MKVYRTYIRNVVLFWYIAAGTFYLGTMGRIFKSVKSFLGYSSKFPISELLRSTEWDKCSPLMAYDKVAEKVKAWELAVSIKCMHAWYVCYEIPYSL